MLCSSFMSNYSSGEICMHCTCTLGSGVIRCKRLFPIACASPPPWKAPTDEFPEWGASNFQCRDKWTGLKHSASDILTRKRQSRSCKDKSHLKPTYQLAQWEVRIEMCDFLPPVTFVCSTQTSNRGRRSPKEEEEEEEEHSNMKTVGVLPDFDRAQKSIDDGKHVIPIISQQLVSVPIWGAPTMTCVESHFFTFQNNKPKYAHFLHSSILMDIFVSQDGGKILIRVSGSRNVFLDKSFQGFVLSWKICLFVSLSISSNRLPPLPLCATSSLRLFANVLTFTVGHRKQGDPEKN